MSVGVFFTCLSSARKQGIRSLKTELLENTFQGEDFQKTSLHCLRLYRNLFPFVLHCILGTMFVYVTLTPKAAANKLQK